MDLKIEKILKMSQEELLGFAYIELIKRGYKNRNMEFTDDYLYAKGNIPVLLVAHCDIVHKELPKIIVNDKQQRILWSPTGIGGDDRCGVYGILKICESFKPYVLFTTEEEVGGLGVKEFTKTHKELPVNFIIEMDRRGFNQVVFYRCDNKDFQNYILSFGLDKQTGSYSDVSTLSVDLDIAGCNMSAGYYKEHTTTEHIIMADLEHTIDVIKSILKDRKNHKFYDCQEIKYDTGCKNYKYYNDLYDDWNGWYYKDGIWKKKEEPSNEKEKEEEKEEEIIDEQIDDEMLKEMLQLEEDYDVLTDKEWKQVYGYSKPKSIDEVYEMYYQ